MPILRPNLIWIDHELNNKITNDGKKLQPILSPISISLNWKLHNPFYHQKAFQY